MPRLRLHSLSWPLVRAWLPWMGLQALRDGWILWTFLMHRTWWHIAVSCLLWWGGKLLDEGTKPVNEPLNSKDNQ